MKDFFNGIGKGMGIVIGMILAIIFMSFCCCCCCKEEKTVDIPDVTASIEITNDNFLEMI